jgi:gamma-glutamylaminecyclotransferase
MPIAGGASHFLASVPSRGRLPSVLPAPREFRLFVYGSLLPGEADHELLSAAEHLGTVHTTAEYYFVELNTFPALVPGGKLEVKGELYRVDLLTLGRIDVRKQHPVLFQRKTIRLKSGEAAETYLMALEQVRGRRRLKVGDWRQRFGSLPETRESPWSRWAKDRSRSR